MAHARKKATENFLVDRSLMKFSHFYFFSYFEDNKPEKKSKKPFVMHSDQFVMEAAKINFGQIFALFSS